MSTNNKHSIIINVIPIDSISSQSTEELADSTEQLRNELLELNYVDSIEHIESETDIPEGSKGVSGADIGSLLVTLVSSSGALGSITSTIQSWLQNRSNKKIKIIINGDTIELSGASSKNEDRLVKSFIDKHK